MKTNLLQYTSRKVKTFPVPLINETVQKKSFPTFHRLQSALRSNNVAYDEHLLLKYIVNASQKMEIV